MRQSRFKRLWYKIYPKFIVTIVGIGVFYGALFLSNELKSLTISISAALIAIPVLIIFYEIWDEKSHRQLNEAAYNYAENEMGIALYEIQQEMKIFLEGCFVYFEDNDIIFDEETYQIKMNEEAKILFDEDGEPYQLKNQNPDWYDDDTNSSIFELDKATIVPVLAENFYLGYQIFDLDLEHIVDRLDELLKHSFIMTRLDDKEIAIIINLFEATKMFQGYIEESSSDLFLRTNINISGFTVDVEALSTEFGMEIYLYSLYYKEHDSDGEIVYEELLEQKENLNEATIDLDTVYILNREKCIILADFITELTENIQKWIKVSGSSTVTDWRNGRINVLK